MDLKNYNIKMRLDIFNDYLKLHCVQAFAGHKIRFDNFIYIFNNLLIEKYNVLIKNIFLLTILFN